jgi:hypothetical protein
LGKAAYELRSKKREQDFTRNRKMPFKKLMRFMPGMVQESSRNALGRFFPEIKEAVRMSRQAFSLARQKVKREALPELLLASAEGSCSEILNAWRGKYPVTAIDPGRIALPRDAELRAEPGATGHERSAPTARVSMLYDIDNGIIADAGIERLAADGRSLAKQHTGALTGGGPDFGGRIPIIVFDRGYPSKDLIKYLRYRKIKYVMRAPKGFNSKWEREAGIYG